MNQKVLLTGFSVLILGIALVGIGLAYHQQTAEGVNGSSIPFIPKIAGSSGSYVLTATFPVVNDSYPVYQTVTPGAASEEVRRLGNLFGLSGEMKSVPSGDEVRLVDDSKDPAAELQYYTNSGAFLYRIPEKVYPDFPDEQADLPSDEETRKIVTDYLAERGLLPDDVYFEKVSVKDQYEHTDLISTTVYNLTKHVSFIKEIQGLRVYNAGVGATINERGEVVSAGSSLRELSPEPVRDVKIVTPEEAYQRLIAGDVVMRVLPDGYDEVVVSDISLGYWMEIKTEPQKHVLPVYVFSCATPSGVHRQYVSAVEESEMQYLT
ncbi:MAG: hypothetical protein PHI67_07215 [Candidatus Methanomethylophilaceae archaeon]|nr:hypothetical protein [Candidatus Methanomethylophilaceae archaeon]